jgi:curved DNA binding protein
LVDGDVVKIDMGVHVDGYIAVGAHTVIVGHTPNSEAPVTGPRANVIFAAWAAAEIAANLIKAGNTNTEVSAAMKTIAEAYGVRAITGTVMHEMKRFVIDGKKNVLLRTDGEERVEACTFEEGEIYSIDIAFSSGEGKPRPTDFRTTVYKRQVDRKYGLKVKAARTFFNDVNKRFPTLPFTTRSFDETAAKLGVRECVTHELLASYPVLAERNGDQVAHVKFTVMLLPTGTTKITGLEKPEGFASEATLPEELHNILNAAAVKAARKKNKKDKAKKAAPSEATA